MMYEKMKPSGVSWLGDIPENWDCKKIGSLFSQRKVKVSDKDYAALSVSKAGVVPQLETAVKTDNGDNRKLVKAGDFVINSRSDRKGSCGVSPLDGSVSLINIVLTPRQDWNNRYVHYLMRSQPFSEEYYHYGRGIVADLWTTRFSEMKNICLPIPPRTEQDQIVRYLDWQVSKINKLIAAKNKEIDVLKETKRAIISKATTQGLSDVDSHEVDYVWLSKIPDDWETKRLKEVFSFGKGLSITKANLVPEGIAVLSYGQVHAKSNTGVKISDELIRYVDEGYLASSPTALVHEGDFIFADTSEDYNGCGNCAYVDSEMQLFAGYHTIIARKKHTENGKYFAYLFQSEPWRYQVRRQVNGVKVYSITQKILAGAMLLVPPIEEQNRIVEYLDSKCAVIDKSIDAIVLKIEKLKEFRNCLISDVVTGQIDVRGIEIPDYEYVEEEADESDEDSDEEIEEQEEE